jgi:DNA-3-methyladenine glycosylase II
VADSQNLLLIQDTKMISEMKAITYLKKKDPTMNKIIALVGNYTIKKRADPFLSLVEAIIYQQLTGKAAESIYKRFLNYYENSFPDPDKILATSEDAMRSFGLSSRKVEYIKILSENVKNKSLNVELFPKMPDEEIIEQLIKMKGIGRWTSEMFLIFCLGRPDVFPLKDLGVRKAIQKWYFDSKSATDMQMEEVSLKWKPYRSIATWYLWKSLSNFDTIG